MFGWKMELFGKGVLELENRAYSFQRLLWWFSHQFPPSIALLPQERSTSIAYILILYNHQLDTYQNKILYAAEHLADKVKLSSRILSNVLQGLVVGRKQTVNGLFFATFLHLGEQERRLVLKLGVSAYLIFKVDSLLIGDLTPWSALGKDNGYNLVVVAVVFLHLATTLVAGSLVDVLGPVLVLSGRLDLNGITCHSQPVGSKALSRKNDWTRQREKEQCLTSIRRIDFSPPKTPWL